MACQVRAYEKSISGWTLIFDGPNDSRIANQSSYPDKYQLSDCRAQNNGHISQVIF